MASPRKYLILLKEEITQFTDPTPTPAANSVLAKNVKITPIKVESEDRGLIRDYFGNSEQILVSEEAMIEFDVEMQGSGTAATAPAWGAALKCCGFSETVATDVQYSPVSTGFKSCTIYGYRDTGDVYKMTGCMGSVSIDMAAKKIPHLHFRFTGKYVPVAAGAMPTGTFTAWKAPLGSLPANTGTLTIDSYAAKVSAFSMDMAVDVTHAIWMNNETIAITDRKPKGSITVEAIPVATKDYFAMVRAATLGVFTLTHGTTAGYKVKLDAPKLQLADIQEVEYNGSLAFQFSTTFNPNAGNDEFKITTS